tara:strand:- start:108631 stop:109797 length:1167 start_codon:yes stop_codon:yes gene_type:complete
MAKKKTSKSDKEPQVKGAATSQSLAVKYRPRKMKDLVGQNHITSQLKGMMKQNKVPGAFLLEGQTGGGKTTLARILHRYLNCEKGTACGKCESCRINPNSHPDLVSINAGENGRVDDIRKLIKGSKVAPYHNKRIILIDEAHKLTGASAEALLVPIEEPSRDTIWILCTTNPEKMLPTIVNRCTRFTMKPVEHEPIVKRLGDIAQKEGVDLSSESGVEALGLIADFSNGSMRQAIALLENVLYAAAGGADISSKDVLASFIQNSEVDLDKAAVSLVAALMNNDLKGAIRFVRKAANPRGMLSKSRWLVDYLIGTKTKTAKFKPYSGRVFEKLAKDKGIEVRLDMLLMLQMALVDAEMKMNSTSIDESVLLQTAIAKFAFDNAEEEEDE